MSRTQYVQSLLSKIIGMAGSCYLMLITFLLRSADRTDVRMGIIAEASSSLQLSIRCRKWVMEGSVRCISG